MESSSHTPAVKTRNLTKHFGEIVALDGLNLDVYPGEVVALLGSNGSGKSTTFRLLLNIYRPSEGDSELLGRPSRSLNGNDFDQIAFVSESQKIPQWMTVREFLDYCAQFYSEWDGDFCRRLLEAFQLDDRPKIKFLSRGQKMKVAVASVLPARPRVLLLDEPFSGLDVETRAQLSELLKSLAREQNLATILTTHDVEEVEPVASRLVLLKAGRVEIDEPLTEFLGRHRRFRFRCLGVDELARLPIRLLRKETDGEEGLTGFVDDYSAAMESAVRSALSAQAEFVSEAINLRTILAARAMKM